MSGYVDDGSDYARQIVLGLLERTRDVPPLESGLSISDLEVSAAGFTEDVEICSQADAPIPAIRVADGQLVPVSVDLALAVTGHVPLPPGAYTGYPGQRRYSADEKRSRLRDLRYTPGVVSLDLPSAIQTFVRGATDFLAVRITGARMFRQGLMGSRRAMISSPQRMGASPSPTPGCTFTITTNTGGLRAHWSGAFRLSANYFNHPTTPTSGILLSGNYVFGVDGQHYGPTIQWDTTTIVSLPGGPPSVHLNY